MDVKTFLPLAILPSWLQNEISKSETSGFPSESRTYELTSELVTDTDRTFMQILKKGKPGCPRKWKFHRQLYYRNDAFNDGGGALPLVTPITPPLSLSQPPPACNIPLSLKHSPFPRERAFPFPRERAFSCVPSVKHTEHCENWELSWQVS
mgnify:CR=1 FL=1